MKTPDLEVENVSNSQNLEENADDVIQEGYHALEDAIEGLLNVDIEHPATSAAYFTYEDYGVSVHHGEGPTVFHVAGEEVDEEEFIEETTEDVRARFKKAIGIYASLDDAQLKFVSDDVLIERYG